MRKIYYLSLIGLVFFSCQKEDIHYKISISGISTNSVSVGDTLEVYIDWENSEYTENISVNINGVSQPHLGFSNNTTLLVKINSTIKDYNCIYINHPNGAEGAWCAFYKVDNPKVTAISTLKGKGGDNITISGIDFLSGDSIAVKINALQCEIENINDTSITFIVPNGCGNGKVKIIYWPDYAGCTPDREIEVGLFSYNFSQMQPISKVKSYTQAGYKYIIERDDLGRVLKRKVLSHYDYILNNEELFVYGSDGLIDTIKHYSNSGLVYYLLYERNNDNSIIEISQFGNDKSFWQKQEHHYLEGKLIQYNSYISSNNSVLHTFSNQYYYNGDKLRIERKNLEADGSVGSTREFSFILDIYNNGYPNIGAPGFIELDDDSMHPYITNESRYSTIKYDDYGRLTSWEVTQSYCQNQNTWFNRKFEYE